MIDPLLDEGLDPKEVWVRVIDQHHIVVPFTPLINYTKERRASRVRDSDFSRRPPVKVL